MNTLGLPFVVFLFCFFHNTLKMCLFTTTQKSCQFLITNNNFQKTYDEVFQGLKSEYTQKKIITCFNF